MWLCIESRHTPGLTGKVLCEHLSLGTMPSSCSSPQPCQAVCAQSEHSSTRSRSDLQLCESSVPAATLLPNLYLIYRVMLTLEGTGKPWRICSFRWMPGKLFVGLWGSSHATGRAGASYRLSVWTSGPHLLRPAAQHHLSCHWIRPSSSHLSLNIGCWVLPPPARPPQNQSRTEAFQVWLLCTPVSWAPVVVPAPTSLNRLHFPFPPISIFSFLFSDVYEQLNSFTKLSI